MIVRIVAFILLFMLPSFSKVEARLFAMEEFFLDNGLRVIVINNPKAPIVKQMLWYKVGSMDEKLGKGGKAHLLEHLMFRGTRNVKGEEFNNILEKNGAEVNAFTSQDVTSYHEFMDVSKLELALFLEADRMKNLYLTKDNFDLERDIVYQERMQVVENNPAANFKENLQRALWQKHPYARPITGEAEEILSLTISDVKNFYDRYYSPANSVLVISGDITINEVQPLIEKYFGNISKGLPNDNDDFYELKTNTKSSLKMNLPYIKIPNVSINFAISSFAKNKEDVYPLIVFSKYLGEGDTSYLHKKLVEDKKIALSVSSSYNPYSRSYGSFSVNVIPVEGFDTDNLMKILNDELRNSLLDFSDDDLEKVRETILANLVYLKDNPEDAAYIVGMLASLGLSLEEINSYEDNLKKVKLDDIKKVVKNMLDNAPCVEGVLLPEKNNGA